MAIMQAATRERSVHAGSTEVVTAVGQLNLSLCHVADAREKEVPMLPRGTRYRWQRKMDKSSVIQPSYPVCGSISPFLLIQPRMRAYLTDHEGIPCNFNPLYLA